MMNVWSARKSILLGGLLSGILSVIPLINLFNIFFMMWMGVGGLVSIYLLKKNTSEIRTADAVLVGAASGLTGGIIFGLFSSIMVFNISEEKIERVLERVGSLTSLIENDAMALIQDTNFRMMFLGIIAIGFCFAIIAGLLGGLIGKSIFFGKETNKKDETS
jgi:hypothetical protein